MSENEAKYGETVEQQIQRVGATKGPRITPADIEANIAGVYFFSADKAVGEAPVHPSLPLLTLCVIVLRNGFTVVGKSACASADNYSAEIGCRVAREDAIRQVWPLMGYALRQDIHRAEIHGQAIGVPPDGFAQNGEG